MRVLQKRCRAAHGRARRGHVSRATPPTIRTTASPVRVPSASPATAHPRTTATTGLTNAYVPTRAGDDTVNSHVYAGSATTATATRYANDPADSTDTTARVSRSA